MFYQEDQYLASFVRRAVAEILFDHGKEQREHEGYLPNGGEIEEYLTQYTGLKDKNGREIYEGDVLRQELTHNGEDFVFTDSVFWANDMGGFYLQREDGVMSSLAAYVNDVEVIGNIYENPGLLEASR
jgi:uncharacterized phage protein (TIGR01671 family)